MKTLFFIAALAGAVYLIMQTPAGKAWLEESEPELNIQQKIRQEVKKVEQVSNQAALKIENKMTELTQHLNQKQQDQITQLENRIAELENELIMGRVTKKQQQQTVSSSAVTLHPYKQAEKQLVTLPSKQGFDVGTQTPDTLVATTDKQLQRNRQARLQDIAQKMEMSSLQALVN
jgi:hypothetical protein